MFLFSTTRPLLFAAISVFLALPTIRNSARAESNLLEIPEIRDAAKYTYYALGDVNRNNVSPFTVPFYPGGGGSTPKGLHGNTAVGLSGRDGGLEDYGGNAEPIPVREGQLTDGVLDSSEGASGVVTGWINTLNRGVVSSQGANTGQFDILFDLGSVRKVHKIVVWYSDSPGHRWVDEQECFTAEAFADPEQPLESDFRFLGSALIEPGSSGSIGFKGEPRVARYINLRFSTSASRLPNATASVGGILYEVQILGEL